MNPNERFWKTSAAAVAVLTVFLVFLTIKEIKSLAYVGSNPPTYQLSLRQKQILSLAEPPNTLVSNKLVQDTFRISQITASRDLAKLASLGLLIPHGHGRSTSYSKA
jgi:predicted HTH transcriptional regulator